jgi:hypothetical protein
MTYQVEPIKSSYIPFIEYPFLELDESKNNRPQYS